jgi:predicted nucleic acid-binding protein
MQPKHSFLRQFIARQTSLAVWAVSYVEVLGFHQIKDEERLALESLFSSSTNLLVDQPVFNQPVLNEAVKLRQQRRMSLGDVLVAATCLVHDLTLVTRNVDDFCWIPNLRLLNPFDRQPAT